MSPNGEPFLLDPEAPAGQTHFPHARTAPPSSTHRTIYVSGIASSEGVTENSDGSFTCDTRKQTAAILKKIDDIIQGTTNGKGGVANVIDAVVYILDMKSQYADMNEEWNKVFKDRATAPARATIGVKELPDPRFVVEVKAVAVVEI
ncbi:endoribonuclease L-PSP [Thozetella sp. PMI_491]|nr:endoribonuclease L-PSP [Thozetella sp. PMI_491]